MPGVLRHSQVLRLCSFVYSGRFAGLPAHKEALVNGRIALVGGALATTLLTPAALISDTAQQGAANSIAARRVEPFTRPTVRRIPTGGGAQAPCPDSLDMCRKCSAFTSHFVANYRIPLRDKELLILRTVWLSRGEFAWSR
jgi:hypothetical protein